METTQIYRNNQALDESEARFEMILQTTPNAILVLDRQQVVVIANRRAERLFGSSGGLLLGQKIERLIGLGKKQSWIEFSHAFTEENYDYTGIFEAYRMNGQAIQVEISLGKMTQQGLSYLILVITDVTSRQQTEIARQEALKAAQSLAEARSFFLANMSHEIRTPLTSVLGATGIGLLDKYATNSKKHRELFEKIQHCGEHLLQVINDVLDFSKIDAGILVIKTTNVLINELLEQCVNDLRFNAEVKNLDLQLISDSIQDLLSVTDSTRLRQIVMNLLSNAIKFTETGFVHLEAQVDPVMRCFKISVNDSGIGIREEHQERVFKPFEQIDSSVSRQYDGTGLGLAISRNLAEKLGGTLEIESEIGKGTRCVLTLPLITPLSSALSDESVEVIEDDCLKNVVLWLVEDDDFNRGVIGEQLQLLGATLIEFTHGQHLIEYVIQHGAKDVDAVLMDLDMPVMNGYEATDLLKQQIPDLPVIALTAHVLNETKNRCLASGMAGYVRKPVILAELIHAIREIL